MALIPFKKLPVGSRFRIPHLWGNGPLADRVVFIKIKRRYSNGAHRPNFPSMPFKGWYNSIAIYGGRWVWGPDEMVQPIPQGGA